jgi:hypothetical protein
MAKSFFKVLSMLKNENVLGGCHGRDSIVVVFMTTNVVSSNPAQARGTRYNTM